ncbi:phage/plasmid primase, P4 family [Actinobaculum sp. 352]|uniref:phage/plasmid primase, P4 family n=1 Tax=Actinobaculum sp. 352 TaxID=2490946 RepID=UPI000F7E2087|nr:phage/plasmid primase, P4 family [Actinobaculum sp. 352]RTE49623.1 hypothetical protein EKN07_06150 [Actinobaculum sp. 352]
MDRTLLDAALSYQAAGLSVVPILPASADRGDKRPAVPWKRYQTTPATRAQVTDWFSASRPLGIGVATGKASNNLIMIELEGRAAARLADLQATAQAAGLTDLWRRVIMQGCSEISPSGGFHYYMHIDGEDCPGNTKLARQPGDNGGVQVLAETRGQGGYSVVAPTPGAFHRTGRGWTGLTGTLTNAPHITPDEYDELCRLFASLDAVPSSQPLTRPMVLGVDDLVGGISPGDDYEAKTSWVDILEPHGWVQVLTRGGETFWRRPGKTQGISASTGHAGDRDRLYVWSTSTVFDAETPYTKLGAYAVLNHGGDHRKAAKQLLTDGYGRQAEHARPRPDVVDDLTPTRQASTTAKTAPEDAGESAADKNTTSTAAALTGDPGNAHTVITSEPNIYTRTDDGNALRFADTYTGHFVYIPERHTWAAWTGHHWDLESGNAKAYEAAKNLARSLPVDTKADETHKRRTLSRSGLDNMLTVASTIPTFHTPYTVFDIDPWQLNTPAGPVDLRTGQTSPPSPASRFLRSTTIAPDPDMPTPAWTAFLDQIFTSDAQLIGFMQRLFGLAIIGQIRERILPFLHGSGANGKTTMLNVIQHVLGRDQSGYTSNLQAEALLASTMQRHPTEIASLAGVRIAIASELEEGQQFAEGRVKLLTGRDVISARFLHQDFFTFTPSHTLFLLGNHEPEVRGGGDAFWDRLRKIPFNYVVPAGERDPGLEDKLFAEAPGILAWILEGTRHYLTGGLATPDAVRVATGQYELEQDTVTQFLNEKCVTGEPTRQDLHIRVAVFRRAYEAWCVGVGERPVSAKGLTQRLRTHGILASKGSRGSRFYDGVRLKEEEQEDATLSDSPWDDLGGR